MRFAYIDSQGNQVAIPSVEALGLRIELGAIGPDTQLYDGQADRWGPASSHEIFHTLSRGISEESYNVPPLVAPTSGTPIGDLESEDPGSPEGDVTRPEEATTPGDAEPVFDISDEFWAPGGEEVPADEAAAEGGDLAPEPEPRVTADDDLPLDLTLIDMGEPAGGYDAAP
ncbi:MAG: hypothetical protein LJF04_19225, partial [Gemmatimonadetes bacterium]|nr:hypothetical protein [Gemmatimonadota bacterium]